MSLELDPAEVAYRLALAREHLDRARRRFQVEDWAGVVEAAQLAAENAAKTVIAHFHVPSWSHDHSGGSRSWCRTCLRPSRRARLSSPPQLGR